MSRCSSSGLAFRTFLAVIFSCACLDGVATQTYGNGLYAQGDSASPRMATFESAGEISFALSVQGNFDDQAERTSDVVVYVDTSASQTGLFKEDSIKALQKVLDNLTAGDRVKVMAVDLDPIPLTDGFVRADSQSIRDAIGALQKRVPLGSTDMKTMLKSAASEFDASADSNRNVLYIGDGISRAGLMEESVFADVINGLVRENVSVSSLAIGPDRNIELLATLANHTGGNVFLDSDDPKSVDASAIGLADTVHGKVFWPQSSELDDSVVESYPNTVPPIREDRDTILVGTLADRDNVNIKVSGLLNGQSHEISLAVMPEAANADFAFLPKLLRDVRQNDGMTMPSVGSAGLREYASMLGHDSAELTSLGKQAISLGDYDTARKLATAAMAVDPSNTTAHVLAKAAWRPQQGDAVDPFGSDSPFGDSADAASPFDDDAEEMASPFGEQPEAAPAEQPDVAEDANAGLTPEASTDPFTPMEQPDVAEDLPAPDVLPMETAPAQQPPATADNESLTLLGTPVNEDAIDRLMKEEEAAARGLILTEEDRRQVINDKIRRQVAFEQKQARAELRNNPQAAIERLKNMIGVLDSTTDLYPETRQDLRNILESALLSAQQRKLEFDQIQAQTRANAAGALAQMRAVQALERREEELARLLNRFNSLMNEENYNAAFDVTARAIDVAPHVPEAVAANEKARAAAQWHRLNGLRYDKANNFLLSIYEIEKANMPFPADPPLVFPDPEVWKAKRLRRAKYDSIRLTGSENDEKILRALEEPATLDYEDTPWRDIEEELESKYKINIVLDQSAIDDALSQDEPVTVNLRGIRLKSALRLMLKKKNATFIVRDEVLQIISLDDAEDAEYFVTNVYNVGDLVAPRFAPMSFGGGFGGGGGGFGGGGGGLGGGGLGGGGGGFGGRGGGGGGVFCIQDSQKLVLGGSADAASNASVQPVSTKADAAPARKPVSLELPIETQKGTAKTWNEYFKHVFADPADVRKTVRDLMAKKDTEQICQVIFGAIQNDQTQPWMYEALTLSLQIQDSPQSEIERALMSAVDLSDDANDAMFAAQYMAAHGMEKRAVRLLQDISQAYPLRTEPFVIGLRAANRIDDMDGIRWASLGILAQEWPDHPEIVKEAEYASDAVRVAYRETGKLDELAVFENDLDAAMHRDCYAKVSWTGDADIDLYMQEPGGTVCSRLEPRTTAGGVMMGDEFSTGSDQSGEMFETYVLPKGFSGDYRLLVKRVWGEVTSGKVTVTIYSHYRSKDQVGETRQLTLSDPGVMINFRLENGRREESLEQHTIESVVKDQLVTNRNVLAQQISNSIDPSVIGSYFGDPFLGPDLTDLIPFQRRNGRLGGNAVGYEPQITTISTGPQLTVNHATTADRLYVLVSLSPLFNAITDVFTFNTTGNADNAQGGGGGGIGGGNGFGGGGTGGFGF